MDVLASSAEGDGRNRWKKSQQIGADDRNKRKSAQEFNVKNIVLHFTDISGSKVFDALTNYIYCIEWEVT
jgi:hypothetical protein